MMRNRYSMPGVQALASALGGQTREDAYDRELKRQMDLDKSRSTIDSNMASAALNNRKAEQVQAQMQAHASRGSDDTLIRALMLRDPTIAPDAARSHVRRASGGPFAAPQYANPDQARMAGETLAGLFATSLADAPTDGEKMADVMFNAGSSAQRLRAPEIAAEDPITAAFMLNAGTGQDAPKLFDSLPQGLGTFGTLTGGMNINQPLQQSVVAENNAQANASNASAGAASALAAQRNAQTALTGQTYDSARGMIIDERAARARPVTTADGAAIPERASGGVNVNIGGRPLPMQALDKLSKQGTTAATVAGLEESFQDDFGGYKSELIGDAANWAGRTFGDDTGRSQWWQEYQNQKNIVRNELFGSALTATEKAEFDKAQIHPGMAPSEIKKNLARQREVAQRAAFKLGKSLAAGGYSTVQIEEALGFPLGDDDPPPMRVDGPTRRAAGRKIVRTGTLPDGTRVVEYDDGSIEEAP